MDPVKSYGEIEFELLQLLSKAVRIGTFELSSGSTSNVLIDCSQVLRTYDGQVLLGDCLNRRWGQLGFDAVGGPLVGSDPISAAVLSNRTATRWFGVRKQGDIKRRGLDVGHLTGSLEPEDTVLLVDDVFTTGGNLRWAASVVEARGGKLQEIFVVVDRGAPGELVEFGRRHGVRASSLVILHELLEVEK